MAFRVQDYYDLVRLLYQHPEWQEELRTILISKEIRELPDLVRSLSVTVDELARAQRLTEQRMQELAEAQRRTEQRVEELAEAQRRTEQRVEELAEAQRRTEQRVEELAEAQRRTEQRVEELAEAQRRTEQRVEELAEAQRRTEQRVEELAAAQERLGKAVGSLQTAFGATVEEEAASVVEVILRRKGYRILQPAYSLPLDGEVDVVLPVEDSAGQRLWVLVEAKARLSRRDVIAWAQRLRSPEWHRRLAEQGCTGPYLPYLYSIRADLGAHEAAAEEGIGLLKSDGEVLAPGGWIELLAG